MIENLLSKFTLSNIIPGLINIIFCIIIVLSFLTMIELISEKYKENKVKGLVKTRPGINKIKNLTFLKTYANDLELVLKEKNKEEVFEFVFYSTLATAFIGMISLISVRQILLAIIVPVIVLTIADKLCLTLLTDISESIEEQLPFTINNIVRISSKYSDIKSIIYESSRNCEQPMKGILENMSREMLSEPADKVLLSYADKYDNVWFYSVVFTLVSYLEDSSKEETIKNLKNIRTMLEKENLVKKANVTDKKYGVVLNLVISLSAIAGFVLNILINPEAKKFFFSTFGGLVCFALGFAFIIITIFMNIKMSKKQK